MTGDFIKITNLKVFAHHGVFPEETRDGQDFYVNAKLFLDCRKAGKTDNLSDSLNYGEVSHFITDFLQDHTYKLIESVAEQLAEAMLLSMPVLKGVEIELCKPYAPIGLPFENVSVTIERQWHEVYLAVGSNLGDKNAYIGNGIDELRRIKEIKEVRVSELLVTKPYGGVEQDDFVNGAIALKTMLSPQELLERLHHIVSSDFVRLPYTEAVKLLEEHKDEFEYPVFWGCDLQTEHERYLTEEIFKKPVFVTDYPKEIKAFYMKMNPDGKTVAAVDCLVPGIGEIIGGSQREDDYDKLVARMDELGLKKEDYGFYLDLRKYGSTRHAGFGLGFERCVMYLTGMSNIRDVIPFPRTVNNCEL